MKKVLLSLALLAGVSAVSFAQGKTLPQPVKSTAAVSNEDNRTHLLQFNTEDHNFGNIKKGDPAETEFTFKNNSTEPVSIVSAKASCGCTVPTYSNDPIAPGKTGSVKVKYDSNRIGKIDKTVTITTNLGVKRVKISGNVENIPTSSAPKTSSNLRNK